MQLFLANVLETLIALKSFKFATIRTFFSATFVKKMGKPD